MSQSHVDNAYFPFLRSEAFRTWNNGDKEFPLILNAETGEAVIYAWVSKESKYRHFYREAPGSWVTLGDHVPYGKWELTRWRTIQARHSDSYLEFLFKRGLEESNKRQRAAQLFVEEKTEDDRRLGQTVIRPDQAKFRAAVFDNCNGRCVITGLNVVMEAAHLVPFADHGPDTADNGLLMRVDIHRLFDLGLMAINPQTMTAHFKPGIGYEKEEGRRITTRQPVKAAYLAARWEAFTKNKAA